MKGMKPILFIILSIAIATACWGEEAKADYEQFSVEVKGEGQPMILIPGLNSPGAVWDQLTPHYTDHYQTHTLTLAGFADMPLTGEPSLQAVKQAISAYILDQKLEKPVLVGHSLGGFLALWIASDMPDHIGPLVIIDSLPFFPLIFNPAATEEGMQPMAAQQTQGIANADATARRQYYTNSVAELVSGPDDIAHIIEWCVESDPRMTAQAMYDMYTTDLRDDIARITTPVLVLGSWQSARNFGGTIESVRAHIASQYTSLPGFTLTMHESAKHFIMLDAPEWTQEQIDNFLP